VLAGAGFYSLILVRSGSATVGFLASHFAVRILLFGLFAVFTVIGGRFSPESLLNDRSGEIRLDLWKAGLRMLHLEPSGGWGIGQSGLQYMHWFQSPDDPKRVAGTIQSYLHIGVERGIFAMWLFTSAILFLPLLAWTGAGEAAKPFQLGTRRGSGHWAPGGGQATNSCKSD